MSIKRIPLLCYWDGRIFHGSQGITYEGAIPTTFKVYRGIQFSHLFDKIYELIGIDSLTCKLKIVCRDLANGQCVALAIDNDESLDIMLDMTKEKGINCVELYIEKSFVSVQRQSNVQFTVHNGSNEDARNPSYVHFDVRWTDGRYTSCRMKPDTPIWKVKTAFSERQKWSYHDISLIRFIYDGRPMREDWRTLNEYGICDDSTIDALMGMRGD